MNAAAPGGDTFATVAGHSVSIAGWTVVSRVTGFARVAVVAAVLGPTFFGNLFQTANLLPNVTYEFLTGSLFASLLVPALVGHVDRGDRRATERLAGGFLGVAALTFAAVAAVTILFGPVLLRLLTLGVEDAAVRAAQHRAGWPLLAMLMPQVVLYGIAGTGVAVQHAHGRFALAAAAPALENVGVILTLLASAVVFGTGPRLESVTTAQLLLLGLGTTAAVGLHAAAQWWGARSVGVTLLPRAGWRDPEVRRIVRLVLPSLGYAGLNATRLVGILVVAGAVPGGVVAFQMAMNFYNLPVAIGSRPVAAALLPHLARLQREHALRRFRDEWVRGVALGLFLTVPAAFAYAVLAEPLARAVSFGEMAGPAGVSLVAASLAALSFGVVGEGNFLIGTHAAYARRDARTPLRGMVLCTALTGIGMVVALVLVEGTVVLVALGLSVAVSDVAASAYLDGRLRSRLPAGEQRLLPAAGRIVLASLVMLVPATALARSLPRAAGGVLGETGGVLVAGIVGVLVFLAVQRATGSDELTALRSGRGQRAGVPR